MQLSFPTLATVACIVFVQLATVTRLTDCAVFCRSLVALGHTTFEHRPQNFTSVQKKTLPEWKPKKSKDVTLRKTKQQEHNKQLANADPSEE